MQARDVHELAADIMLEMAGTFGDDDLSYSHYHADAMRNAAHHIHAGCDAPNWALELADVRLSYGSGRVA